MTFDRDRDAMSAARAALDQMLAMVRDLYGPGIVEVEKIILEEGGTPELAAAVASKFLTLLFTGGKT